MEIVKDFAVKNIQFTPYCDDYNFILGCIEDNDGNKCYLGIDIPCKNDSIWRFWLLFNDNTIKWNLSDKDTDFIKKKTTEYCLSNGYKYNGKYFELIK